MNNKKLKNSPEKFASFYTDENLSFSKKLVKHAFKSFQPYFKGKSCLELGPATGYMTVDLVTCFEKVTAVEGSKTLASKIPAASNLEVVQSLFEDYKPKDHFDTIVCNHVLEHIAAPVELLKSIKGWVKPDGVVILGVPNAKSFHRLAAVSMGLLKTEYSLNQRDLELGHFRVYDMESFCRDITEAGFCIIDKSGVFLKFLSNQQIDTFLDDAVVDAYFSISRMFPENCAEIFVVCKPK